jgi:hypothetical protein
MMLTGGTATRAAAIALFAALSLGSCGSDDPQTASPSGATTSADPSMSPEPSREPSEKPSRTAPPGTPQCADVWKEGATLPRFYAGCAEGNDYVRRESLSCSSGQRIVQYADRFYGVLTGTVHKASGPLDDDSDYRAAVRRCRA